MAQSRVSPKTRLNLFTLMMNVIDSLIYYYTHRYTL